ncbi:MAG: SUMF1/EgtB/PvdO family nonheme iron enzyme [Sorangiineae bacterium]|nr:SUMF1/EgtB/PvdO family nonheme iron enzyme [Polyangiaceae bacterium]MEB2321745.1 SUMF1/EgtB/PvdO family nonheme iron enzyme [Sorangiineae bacterium]
MGKRLAAGVASALFGCAAAPLGAPAAPAPRPRAAALSEPPVARAEPTPPPASEPVEEPAPPRFTCPDGMALVLRVQGPYCVDRWEASLVMVEPGGSAKPWPPNQRVDGKESRISAVTVPGTKPQGYISGKQAARACEHAGKRLCEIDEWVLACRGPARTIYPYGNERRARVCNDRYKKLDNHPVTRLFEKHAPPGTDPARMWWPEWMNDPRLFDLDHSVAPTGSFAGCTNEYGVYDMVGNLHEWVADEEGTFFGGYLMDTFQNGEGCEYRTTAHPYDYHDYSTGFRCCADARRDE